MEQSEDKVQANEGGPCRHDHQLNGRVHVDRVDKTKYKNHMFINNHVPPSEGSKNNTLDQKNLVIFDVFKGHMGEAVQIH